VQRVGDDGRAIGQYTADEFYDRER